MQPTTKLTLTLEWFLNPDHLPFIAGVTTGAYEQAGLDITIIEPDDHYDGFAELQHQSIDLHVNSGLFHLSVGNSSLCIHQALNFIEP